jgi:hypothetical protein
MKSVETKARSNKKYVFFISHSTQDIYSDVSGICDVLEKTTLKCFVADRDAPIGESLPTTIKNAIDDSELLLVILTKHSKYSPWVNQEIGYALGKNIPVIPLKKGKIIVKGLIESVKYIPMKENPLDTVLEINSKLANIGLSKKAEAAMGILVGTLQLADKYRGAKN